MLTCHIQLKIKSRMSFVDAKIISEDKTFTPSVYCKLSFSGVNTNFENFLPSTYHNFDTVYTLAYKCFLICSSQVLAYEACNRMAMLPHTPNTSQACYITNVLHYKTQMCNVSNVSFNKS